MARRKIDLQDTSRKQLEPQIDQLVKDMGSSELGFSPTDQVIYEVVLNRILPDLSQSRRLLPFDLREKLSERRITPSAVMAELKKRADQGNQLALLVLGGNASTIDEAESDFGMEEDKGLLALANSIRTVGLRQPVNIYAVPNPENPGEPFYQIGEGERRYWAHQLLVLQGYAQFSKIKAIIEPLPDDQVLVQRRQEAENAARQDLSAVARARSIKRIRGRLSLSLGTRVPGQTTIKLPSQRELDEAIGQEVKTFTGRAISGRMVRNYLRLLSLSLGLQDLAEAAHLTEKQLRPVMRLKTDAEQLHMIKQIINEKLSGRAVLDRVKSASPSTSIKRTIPTTLEQRLEKRLFQVVKTVHEVFALGRESYVDVIQLIAPKMSDATTQEALQALRQVIDDLIGQPDAQSTPSLNHFRLDEIAPPIDMLIPLLPATYETSINDALSSSQIMTHLLSWQRDDPILASALHPFLNQIEERAVSIKAGQPVMTPTARTISESDNTKYRLVSGKMVFWAYVSLTLQGFEEFETISVDLVD